MKWWWYFGSEPWLRKTSRRCAFSLSLVQGVGGVGDDADVHHGIGLRDDGALPGGERSARLARKTVPGAQREDQDGNQGRQEGKRDSQEKGTEGFARFHTEDKDSRKKGP